MNEKEYQRAYQKEYRKKNREKLNNYKKEWQKKNKDHCAKYKVENKKSSNEKRKILRHDRGINVNYRESAPVFLPLGTKKTKERIKIHYGCLNPECKWGGKLSSHCLDFHHINPKEKLFNIACEGTNSILIKEINKCTILCAICHRMATWGELDVSNFKKCNVNEEGLIIDTI